MTPTSIILTRGANGFVVDARRPAAAIEPELLPTLDDVLEFVRREWAPESEPDELAPRFVRPAPRGARTPGPSVEPAPHSTHSAVLARGVDRLEGVLPQTRDALRAARIRTFGELVERTAAELLELRGFGRIALRDVEASLARVGLRLRRS